MSSLFGGSSSKSSQTSTSSSSNQAYPYLQQSLGGLVSQGTGAGSQLANLLGLNGGDGQNAAFDNWRNSTGYNFGLNQGTQAITGNAASRGLLNSGSTAKALTQFGNDYASTKYGDYTNMLQGLLGSGLSAANTIGGAGQISNSQSSGTSKGGSNTGGLGSALGHFIPGVGSLLSK